MEEPNLIVRCEGCGFENVFPQPYRYHAGFGDTVFLYNEAGNCTLIWGTYDEAYQPFIKGCDFPEPSEQGQRQLEALLPLSPRGDRWSFKAPARCGQCHAEISAPLIGGDRYYLKYPGSVMLGRAGFSSNLGSIIQKAPASSEHGGEPARLRQERPENTMQDTFRQVRVLVDQWCERRELHPLATLLPGMLAYNGLTDGFIGLYQALRCTRGLGPGRLSEDDMAVLNEVISTLRVELKDAGIDVLALDVSPFER